MNQPNDPASFTPSSWVPNHGPGGPETGYATHNGMYGHEDVRDEGQYDPALEPLLNPRKRIGGREDSALDWWVNTLSEYSTKHWVAVLLLPWAVFTLVMLPFALGYRRAPAIAWIVFWVAVSLVAYLLLRQRRASNAPRMFFATLGGWCGFAVVVGALLGFYDYHKYIEPYFVYKDSAIFNDVLASAHPGATKDAGALVFSADALVDTRQSVGLKIGDTFCAAPIVSRSQPSDFVGFWAVGTNCCRSRGGFACGETLDVAVHSSPVVLDLRYWKDPLLPMYRAAAEQSAAAFGLRIPVDATFVLWASDPVQEQDALWDSGVLLYVGAIFIYLLITMVLGGTAVSLVRRPGL